MNAVSQSEFKRLVKLSTAVFVGILTPAGGVLYFEISKELAEHKTEDLAKDNIPFKMDGDRFLWIGESTSPLRVH